jgi:hypothetical protein
MHFHMYTDKEVNKNVKTIFFINVWRKIVFDICFTGFGTALTTILPILFQYYLPEVVIRQETIHHGF